MIKLFTNTSNKFITTGICIFFWVQLDSIYEKIRGTVEGMVIAGQVNNDNTIYLWSKLLSEGLIIQVIHSTLGLIIGIIVIKIITTIYTNIQMNKSHTNE